MRSNETTKHWFVVTTFIITVFYFVYVFTYACNLTEQSGYVCYTKNYTSRRYCYWFKSLCKWDNDCFTEIVNWIIEITRYTLEILYCAIGIVSCAIRIVSCSFGIVSCIIEVISIEIVNRAKLLVSSINDIARKYFYECT